MYILDLQRKISLAFTLKAMNDTMNECGLFTSLVVIGTLPRLINTVSTVLRRKERIKALTLAHKEMESIAARRSIANALLPKMLLAAQQI